MAEFVDGGAGGFLVDDRVAHPAVPWVNDRSSPAGMPTAPLLPDDLEQLLRRLRMPRTRAAAPEMIATATSQRWEPAECCAPCSPPSSPGGTGPRWRPGEPGRDLRGRIEHLRARTRPNPTPTSAPDSENTLILALTGQINELKKRLRQDVPGPAERPREGTRGEPRPTPRAHPTRNQHRRRATPQLRRINCNNDMNCTNTTTPSPGRR